MISRIISLFESKLMNTFRFLKSQKILSFSAESVEETQKEKIKLINKKTENRKNNPKW